MVARSQSPGYPALPLIIAFVPIRPCLTGRSTTRHQLSERPNQPSATRMPVDWWNGFRRSILHARASPVLPTLYGALSLGDGSSVTGHLTHRRTPRCFCPSRRVRTPRKTPSHGRSPMATNTSLSWRIPQSTYTRGPAMPKRSQRSIVRLCSLTCSRHRRTRIDARDV